MYRKLSVFVLILLQLGFFAVGLKSNPYLIVGLPLILILVGYLILNPMISLLLFNLSSIVKGFLINLIPILGIIDYSFLFTIIIWFGLFRMFLIGKWEIPNWSKPILIIYLFFCIYLSFSIFFTPSPEYGLQKIIRFVIFNSTMFFTPFIIIKSTADSKKILLLLRNMLVVITLLMIIYVLYNLLVSNGISVLLRISILGANPIAVASFLAVATGFISVVMIRGSYKNWFIYFPILLVLIVGLISTGSRGPILSLVLGLISYLLIFDKMHRKKGLLLSCAIILVVIISLFILPENLTNRYLNYTTGDLIIQREGVTRVSTIAMRWQYWQMSINQWLSNIVTTLFGVGSGGFSSFYILRDYRFYPHNMFVEVLLELGLIGITLFLAFWIKIFKIILSSNIKSTVVVPFWTIAFLIRFYGSQFSGDIGGNRDMWLYLSITLVSIYLEKEKINVNAVKDTYTK